MKVLFASGDVGGARAILPIVERCLEKGIDAAFVDNGHISKEAPSHLLRIAPELLGSKEQFDDFLFKSDIRVFVFASSLKDSTALTLARWMKAHNIPVIHVLDHWNSYQSRMETDGLPAFIPDHYAVMDSIAFEAATEAGIDESILLITGQPALSNLAAEFAQWKTKIDRSILDHYGFDPNKRLISFISEPVEHDQGATLENPGYRGYTEKEVIRRFCEILQPFAKDIQIAILPHPREEQESLDELWNAHKGELFGRILNLSKGRYGVFMSDGVAGMGSVLMYEAWLLGKPVISLQPGLRIPSLQMLQHRQDVVFVDTDSEISKCLTEWITKVINGIKHEGRSDLIMHEKSTELICNLIVYYVDN